MHKIGSNTLLKPRSSDTDLCDMRVRAINFVLLIDVTQTPRTLPGI